MKGANILYKQFVNFLDTFF